jgi:hypothetical protein
MLPYILGFVLGSRGIPRLIRVVLVILAIGFVIAVTVYTLHVILTLPERTTGHHVYANPTH